MEDSSTSSDDPCNEDDVVALKSSARDLAIEAVSAELRAFSEGPKSAPRCSRLRRHFSERAAGDPAAASTVLNALGGVIVEALFGVAVLKGKAPLCISNLKKERNAVYTESP